MARLAGSIIDEATGDPMPARVQVIASTGDFLHPPDAILKVGSGHVPSSGVRVRHPVDVV